MSARKIGITSALGLVIAALGILVPIVYERHQRKKSLELRQLASASVVTNGLNVEKLQIMYAGRPVPTLTKYTFALVNNGRTPVRADEVVEAPHLDFSAEATVLEVQQDSASPAEVSFTTRVDSASGRIQILFPLLNPSEQLHFSVLVAGARSSYTAVSRIAGAPRLAVRIVDPSSRRSLADFSASTYVGILFTAFGWLLVVVIIHMAGSISVMRRLYAAGTMSWPSPPTREGYQHLIATLRQALSTDTAKALELSLKSMPAGHNLTSSEQASIQSLIGAGIESRVGVWGAAILFGALAMAGTSNILSYWLLR